MRKSAKAVLLSTLVFPGAGHFSLKKPIQGTLLLGITLFCLYWIVSTVLEITQNLTAKIERGEIPFDVAQITQLVSQQLSVDDQLITISTYGLVICWIVGIVDSYRIGRLQDKNENNR
ncbi:MAG: hypothetical protein V7749_10740, partial [Cocleimonas sp.]